MDSFRCRSSAALDLRAMARARASIRWMAVAQHMLSVLSVKSYECVIIKFSGLASSGLKIYFALDVVVGVYANSIFRAYYAQ